MQDGTANSRRAVQIALLNYHWTASEMSARARRSVQIVCDSLEVLTFAQERLDTARRLAFDPEKGTVSTHR